MAVTRLLAVSITVAERARTAAFYHDGLGLDVGAERTLAGPAWNHLLGLEIGTTVHAADIVIGSQKVELLAFDPPGKPYPSERAANDQSFEHVALVTGDIVAASERLMRALPETITKGAPVLLPPNTGAVTAFKFRDPEGHPLELISFPADVGDPAWHQGAMPGIRGYDHTAISVMDMERSLAFYAGVLGLRLGARSLNQGPEQDRLDGLTGCEVDVVALEPVHVPTPHLELLHYRSPRGRSLAVEVEANDVVSTRQIHRVDDLDALVKRLDTVGARFVSPGVVTLGDGRKAASVQDPDGHMILLME